MPQVTMTLQALPILPELIVHPHGGWDVTVDVAAMVTALNDNMFDVIKLESLRGLLPLPDEAQQAMQYGMSNGHCEAGWVGEMVKGNMMDNILGRNVQWTPGSAKAKDDIQRLGNLRKAHSKPGYRYLAGRIGPDARLTGSLDAVAWQDERIAIDARLHVRPAARNELDELEPGLAGDYIIEVRSSTGGPVDLDLTLLNPESSNGDISRLFFMLSTGGWNPFGDNDNKFQLSIGVQLTMVLHNGTLRGCFGGACCSKSVTIGQPVFKGGSLRAAVANKLAAVIPYMLNNVFTNLVGRSLPKLLKPVVDNAVSAGISVDGGLDSFGMQLDVSTEIGDPLLHVKVTPEVQSGGQPGKVSRHLSGSIYQQEGLLLNFDQGVVDLTYNPLNILAKTLLSNLDLSVAKSRQKLVLPFEVFVDSALSVQATLPTSRAEVFLRQLLKNAREVYAQPPLFWHDRASDFGIPAMTASDPHATRCALRKPEGPSQSRKPNRHVDFGSPFDEEKAIPSMRSELTTEIKLSRDSSPRIVVSGSGSFSMLLDEILPMVANDPGVTEYYFADYDGGTLKTYDWKGSSKKRVARVVCGWLAFNEKPKVDLLALSSAASGTALASVHAGKHTYLEVGGYSLYGADAVVRDLARVVNQEAVRQSFNQAIWNDAKCKKNSPGPSESTAFSAFDAHITSAFRWRGEALLGPRIRSQEAHEQLARCQDACAAHPPCRAVRLLRARREHLPDTVACSYSSAPVPEGEGVTKDWISRGAS